MPSGSRDACLSMRCVRICATRYCRGWYERASSSCRLSGIEAPDSQLTVAPNVWEELGGYRSELARVLLETGERPSGPIPVSPDQTVPGHSLLEAEGLVKTLPAPEGRQRRGATAAAG